MRRRRVRGKNGRIKENGRRSGAEEEEKKAKERIGLGGVVKE